MEFQHTLPRQGLDMCMGIDINGGYGSSLMAGGLIGLTNFVRINSNTLLNYRK